MVRDEETGPIKYVNIPYRVASVTSHLCRLRDLQPGAQKPQKCELHPGIIVKTASLFRKPADAHEGQPCFRNQDGMARLSRQLHSLFLFMGI